MQFLLRLNHRRLLVSERSQNVNFTTNPINQSINQSQYFYSGLSGTATARSTAGVNVSNQSQDKVRHNYTTGQVLVTKDGRRTALTQTVTFCLCRSLAFVSTYGACWTAGGHCGLSSSSMIFATRNLDVGSPRISTTATFKSLPSTK